jgi:MFS family permease
MSLRFHEDVSQNIPPSDPPLSESPSVEELPPNHRRFIRNTIILVFLFCLLGRANGLADFIFSPFIVAQYGGSAFALLQIVTLFGTILSLALYPLMVKASAWISPRSIPLIIICGAFAIITWIVVVTGPFCLIVITTTIAIGAGILLNFAWFAIIIDCTPLYHRNFVFQGYAVALSGGTIVLNYLGLLLSIVIGSIGVFYCVAGLLVICLPIVLSLKVSRFKQLVRDQIAVNSITLELK